MAGEHHERSDRLRRVPVDGFGGIVRKADEHTAGGDGVFRQQRDIGEFLLLRGDFGEFEWKRKLVFEPSVGDSSLDEKSGGGSGKRKHAAERGGSSRPAATAARRFSAVDAAR